MDKTAIWIYAGLFTVCLLMVWRLWVLSDSILQKADAVREASSRSQAKPQSRIVRVYAVEADAAAASRLLLLAPKDGGEAVSGYALSMRNTDNSLALVGDAISGDAVYLMADGAMFKVAPFETYLSEEFFPAEPTDAVVWILPTNPSRSGAFPFAVTSASLDGEGADEQTGRIKLVVMGM